MNFLEIARALSVELGLAEPDSVVGADDDARKMRRFINETGTELARRVEWRALRKTVTLAGDGSSVLFDLPDDYDRMGLGLSVVSDGPVRGSLSSDEWLSLAPVAGTPRYYWLSGDQIGFYPFPANTKTATVAYQSKNWAKSNAGEGKEALTANDDSPLLPGPLFVRGAVWRWMRHVGRDYGDHAAEFEAQLQDYAKAEGGVRIP